VKSGSANGPARNAWFDLIEVITIRMIGQSHTAASANMISVALTFGGDAQRRRARGVGRAARRRNQTSNAPFSSRPRDHVAIRIERTRMATLSVAP